jgi:glutathione S-transferase
MNRIRLYSTDISVYSVPVRIALDLKGIPYESLPPPGGYGSAEYNKIVYTGKIPALVHDNFVISESAVILQYIEEAFPSPTFPSLFLQATVSSDPIVVAQQNAIIRYAHRIHDLYLEPTLRSLFPHMNPIVFDQSFFNEKFAFIHHQLQDLEDHCHPTGNFYAGDHLTIADCVLSWTLTLADLMHAAVSENQFTVDYTNYPNLQRIRRLYSTHPVIQPAYDAAYQATMQWLKSKRES